MRRRLSIAAVAAAGHAPVAVPVNVAHRRSEGGVVDPGEHLVRDDVVAGGERRALHFDPAIATRAGGDLDPLRHRARFARGGDLRAEPADLILRGVAQTLVADEVSAVDGTAAATEGAAAHRKARTAAIRASNHAIKSANGASMRVAKSRR